MLRSVCAICASSIVIFSLSLAWAIPPSDLKLSYSLETKTLHIEMSHVSTNLRKHHIRRIVVFKNDQEIEDLYLNTQTTASSVVQDVVLNAKDKDVIRVKAICSEAGFAEGSLTVVEESSDEKSGSK